MTKQKMWMLIVGITCSSLLSTAGSPPEDDSEKSVIDFSGFDKSVRPQDDFFRHVNGTWIKNTEIPSDKPRWGSFLLLRDAANDNVQKIIDELSESGDLAKGSDSQKIRDMYRSYLNEKLANKLGYEPIKAELQAVDDAKTKSELTKLMAAGDRLGVQSPLGFGIGQDSKDPDNYIVYISQSGLSLPDRDYYLGAGPRYDALRAKYVEFVTRMFELIGDEAPPASAQTIMDLEKRIAEHHWTRVQSRDRDKTYNKVSLKKLQSMAPSFEWKLFLDGVGLSEQSDFVVRQPSYVDGFNKVFESTELDALKTYVKFKVVDGAADFLSDPFSDANFEFYSRTLSGLQEPEPRARRAVNTVNGTLGQLVGKEYVKRHFPANAKDRMVKLVENLKIAMGESIRNLEWMTEETKKEALTKLGQFNTKIGYPDKWRDYSKLAIDPDDLVGNMKRVSAFMHQEGLAKLGRPVDKAEWFMSPQTVNAYYNPSFNEVVFPAAILQPPFFHLDADDAVNYGAIGAVIGHEIGHGFDDQGRKSDGTGMLRDWWTKDDAAEYKKRTDMLVKQFNSFEAVEGETVNGELTLGENIGDLGGITLAYRAYQKSLGGKPASKIKGYTGEQRFFLSSGQIWRVKAREDYVRRQLKTDPHAPPEFRVIGTLRNFGPFYDAFELKAGDKMFLPKAERVSIW